MQKGWHSRGYLPHFDGQVTQFITFRLSGSIPRSKLQSLKFRRETGQIDDIEYHREVEIILDTGFGPIHLAQAEIAAIVEGNFLMFDGKKYRLLHWVIMPNHVRVLLIPIDGYSLSRIMHSMKSYTANRANKLLGLAGRFWAVEYYDRYIRNIEHYEKTVAYIHNNPVKAGLCTEATAWPYACKRMHG